MLTWARSASVSVLCGSLWLTLAGAVSISAVRRANGDFSDTFTIENTIASPDGFSRSAVLVNGEFPGPLVSIQKGGKFQIDVNDQLVDQSMPVLTSIHWHGIFQRGTNFEDGTSYITQCPITPGHSFTYQFSAPGQTGTYWYHSHYSTQYCDGLRGPIVIYDPHDPLAHLYDVDDESTIISLADWYHAPSSQLNNVAGPVIPDATLINGLGRYVGGPPSPLSVISVTKGLRYRFRVIGMSCTPWFNFTIDGHQMTIIEADGVETQPMVVDSLPVFAGQRYSVVVNANQPIGNYWIRAVPNEGPQGFTNGVNQAILRYKGAPVQDPTTQPGPYLLPFDESKLQTLLAKPVPGVHQAGKADVSYNLVPGLVNGFFEINNASFQDPSVPVLLQILSGATHVSQLLPKGSFYNLPPNKVIDISIPATNGLPDGALGAPHPIHLHGHNFWVIRSAGSQTYNFNNPVRRDVVTTGFQGDNVTIRFVTDNAGPWFFHCHIDWHLRLGFAVVMAESLEEAAQQQGAAVTSDWRNLCPANLTSSH